MYFDMHLLFEFTANTDRQANISFFGPNIFEKYYQNVNFPKNIDRKYWHFAVRYDWDLVTAPDSEPTGQRELTLKVYVFYIVYT